MKTPIYMCSVIVLLASCSLTVDAQNNDFCKNKYSIMGFDVGVDTLADIKARLGSAEEFPRNEGEDRRICYRVENVAFVFESGAMGGWETLTGYGVMEAELLKNKSLCKSIDKDANDIQAEIGLHLGDTENNLIKKYGLPFKTKSDTIFYKDVHRRKMSEVEYRKMKKQWPALTPEEGYWDVSCFGEFVFSEGKLVSMKYRKVESY